MESPLVVGVDGSDASLAAVDWGADEAVRHALPLRIVHASLWERYEGTVPDTDADRLVRAAADRARLRAPGLPLTTDVLPEDPSGALLREGADAALLVLGCRGRGKVADLLLGSVSLGVAARASCPVVVVRGDAQALESRHGRVLLGVGEHDVDGPAVRFAFREAAARGAELDAVRAWRRPSHTVLPAGGTDAEGEGRASERLDEALDAVAREHPGVRLLRSTVEGPAHRVLTERSAAADLLVVGALRRDGLVGLELGRVAHRALHHASCPVAVVPQRPPAPQEGEA
ncbi:universal stress protein [Streptomyces showdoensis]|uniref:Universal stress protein n=1 Tax=Streptomyces showdoensis TaxID=68268 RepID=A0A2P2GX05_STREW|nr:universal stress protein [Streptomyces showdoensis]KKZ75429.1 universal stress protein [Streptomyces showdoensis]